MKKIIFIILITTLIFPVCKKDSKAGDKSKNNSNIKKELVVESKIITGYKEKHTDKKFNKVGYQRYFMNGAEDRPILIIISGYVVDSAWFDRMARILVEKNNIEVWTLNRRDSLAENRELLNMDISSYIKNKKKRSALYKKLNNPSRYLKADINSIAHWGYSVQMEDIKKVVEEAKKINKNIFLSGWSDGVEYVMTYAHYKFKSGFGSKDIKGLVFLDENPEWGRLYKNQITLDKKILRQEKLFKYKNIYMKYYPSLGVHELAAELALNFPKEKSPLAKKFRLPEELQKKGITNKALIGWLYDNKMENYTKKTRGAFAYLLNSGDIKEDAEADNEIPFSWLSYKLTGDVTNLNSYINSRKAPGRIWELFYPRKVISDYFLISKCDYNCPEFNIYNNKSNKLPIFYILTSTNIGTYKMSEENLVKRLSGLSWYMSKNSITLKEVKLLPLFNYAHADIFFAEDAPATIYKPLAEWIIKKSN